MRQNDTLARDPPSLTPSLVSLRLASERLRIARQDAEREQERMRALLARLAGVENAETVASQQVPTENRKVPLTG